MRINCPNCSAGFQIADGAIGATGRKVRCARCGSVWHAMPGDDAPEEPVDEAALDEAFDERPAPRPEADDAEWRSALGDDDPPKPVRTGDLDDDDPFSAEISEDDDFKADDATVAGFADAAAEAVPDADATPAEGAKPGHAEGATVDAVPSGFKSKGRTKPRKKPAPGPNALARITGKLSSLPPMVTNGAAIGLIAGVAMLGFFARESLVSVFPDFAGLYEAVGLPVNLRGLAFEEVRTYREVDGATPVLVVEGMVRMILTEGERPVPQLRFSLISSTGREVYAWTMDPARSSLRAGESFRFKTRLAAPPEAAVDAQVRFMDRRGS